MIEEAGKHADLRLRLPVGAGLDLVGRPDAGQLLPAHLPAAVRPGDGDLLRHLPEPPRLVRAESDHGDHPVPAGRVPARGQTLRPADQGPAPLDALDEHDPRLGGRRVPADHQQRRHLRGAGLQPLAGAAGRHAAGLLAADLQRGAADVRRRPRRPLPAREGAGGLRAPQPDGPVARRGHAAAGASLPRAWPTSWRSATA